MSAEVLCVHPSPGSHSLQHCMLAEAVCMNSKNQTSLDYKWRLVTLQRQKSLWSDECSFNALLVRTKVNSKTKMARLDFKN